MLEISGKNVSAKEIEQKTYALKTLRSRRTGRMLARWLVGITVGLFVCLFLPWQQNVEATGFMTALKPQDRPQEVQTAIAGRIRELRVQEGQKVKKNDTLVVLAEIKTDYFDPELIDRTKEQKEAKEQGIGATNRKIGALDNQIGALQQGLQLSLQKARNKVIQAQLKVQSAEADYEASKIALTIAQRQYDSYTILYDTVVSNDPEYIPLISRTDWEKRSQKLQESKAKVVSAQNKYLEAKNELKNAEINLNSLEAEYLDKISKSESEKSSAYSYLADAQGELAKVKNKLANLVIRNNQYYILAPQDGYVVKVLKMGIGETLKENDAVATIMPEDPSIAAELYVDAMNVPLLSKGRKVRLEFDGWPALQVTGWPSVTVGTFGGIIQVIDYVDSKNGKYRILVTPDPEDEPWPKQIRVGSGVYGWVMLENVPVWFEVWRQLNGFPPSLYEDPNKQEEGKDKKQKKSDKKIKVKVK